MEKTIKQIADELGIDKQKIYRFIKQNNIKEVHRETHQKNAPKHYDEIAQNIIKQAFCEEKVHQESTSEAHQKHINDALYDALLLQLEVLKNELEVKNKQIAELSKALDQQQQLNAHALKTNELLVENVEEKHWWKFWK